MKPLYFLSITLLLFVQLASALPCDRTTHPDLCEQVLESNLTDIEKENLITDLIQDKTYFPAHDFVFDWNIAVDTSTPPTGIAMSSNGFIKDVWLKLLAAMPSILQNNILFISDSGKLLSAYNHRIEIPPNYHSPGYPATKDSDCKTIYKLRTHESVFEAYINNNFIGDDNLVDYVAVKDCEFKGNYEVVLKTDIDHWKWRRYCCARNRRGICTKYCASCDFRYTEHKVDVVNVVDSFEAKYFSENAIADFKLIDQYKNTSKGFLNATNFSSVHLSFADSNFSEYNYVYSLNRSISPHEILTVKAEKQNRESSMNLNVRGNQTKTITLKNTRDCSLTVFDHFSEKEISCNLIVTEENPVISTDKLTYEDNETIIVKIEPDKMFNITYAGTSYRVRNEIRLTARYPYNKISILYNDKEISQIIHVKDNKSWSLFYLITVFGGVNYVLVEIVRKLWGGLA